MSVHVSMQADLNKGDQQIIYSGFAKDILEGYLRGILFVRDDLKIWDPGQARAFLSKDICEGYLRGIFCEGYFVLDVLGGCFDQLIMEKFWCLVYYVGWDSWKYLDPMALSPIGIQSILCILLAIDTRTEKHNSLQRQAFLSSCWAASE
jgi:hypothetical protein